MSKIPTRGPLDDSVKLGIPSVTTDPESLRRAAIALTRAIEELARQRGDVGRSAVRVNDLVKLGLVSPDSIHTLDPGGATYIQRGAAGFPVGEQTPTAPTTPVAPDQPVPNPSYSYNDLVDLPDCFYPCEHTHPWDDIIGKPTTYPPEPHTHEWTDIPEHPHDGLVLVDCCGFIVKDCTQITEGGVWEYSNFALSLLHNRALRPTYLSTSHGSRQRPIIVPEANFASLADNYIGLYESTGTTFPVASGDSFNFKTLNKALENVETRTYVNAGDTTASSDKRFNPRTFDPATDTHVNFGGTNFSSMNIYVGGNWAGEIRPYADSPNDWAFLEVITTYDYSRFAFRNGSFFAGFQRFGNAPADVNYDRIFRWDSWNTGSITLPSAISEPVSGLDPSAFDVYYEPDGSSIYALLPNWTLKTYDFNLVLQSTEDYSWAQPSGVTPAGFAILGDFFFVQHGAWLFDIWRISTQTKVASFDFSTLDNVVDQRDPHTILPHPDGTVYVQNMSDGNIPRLYAFKWADATFIPEVVSETRFDCRQIEVAGGTSTDDPFVYTIQEPVRVSTPERFSPELDDAATNPGERRRGRREISDRVIKELGIVSTNFSQPSIYNLSGEYNNRLFWRTIDVDTGAILESGDFYAPTIENRNSTSDTADTIRGASNHWIYGANPSPEGSLYLRAGAAASPALLNGDGENNWTWAKPNSNALYVPGRGFYLVWRTTSNTFAAPSHLCFYPCPTEDSLPASGTPAQFVEIEWGDAYVWCCGTDGAGNLYIAVGSTRANRVMRVYDPTSLAIIREFPLNSLDMGSFDSTPPSSFIFGGLGDAQYFVYRNAGAWAIYEVPVDATDPVLVDSFSSVDSKPSSYPDRSDTVAGRYLYANVYDEIWELTSRTGTGGVLIDPCRLTITNGDAQAGNPVLDLCEITQGLGGDLRARTVDQWGRVIENRPVVADDIPELPIAKITGLQTELDSKADITDAATYEFAVADSLPYKQFIYDTGLLVTINIYDDAGLTNLRYSKQLVRTGDFLTSIVLTRQPDLAQWTKTLTYNLDNALETVATVAV